MPFQLGSRMPGGRVRLLNGFFPPGNVSKSVAERRALSSVTTTIVFVASGRRCWAHGSPPFASPSE